MYRVVALGLLFLVAAACGGGGAANDDPTPTATPEAPTVVETVAGARAEGTPIPEGTNPDGTYTVAAGDTLWDIAARFNTTVEVLVSANELPDADSLVVGQVLKVSVEAAATPETATVTVTPQ